MINYSTAYQTDPFYAIFLKSAHAIVILSGDRIVNCNNAAIQFFEALDKEDLLNTPAHKLLYTTKSSRALFQNVISNTHAHESWKAEMLCYTLKRKILHANTSFTSFQGHNGNQLIYSIWVESGDSRSVFTGHERQTLKGFSHDVIKKPLLVNKSLNNNALNSSERNGHFTTLTDDQSNNGVLDLHQVSLNANRYAIIEFDIKSNQLRFERKFCEYINIGTTEEEFLVLSPETFTLRYVIEDQKDELLVKWSQLKKIKPNSYQSNRFEFAIINDLGKKRHLQFLLKNVLDESGDIRKYHGIAHDFTDKIDFEESLRKYKSNLEYHYEHAGSR